MGRSPCCDKSGLKKGPWTEDEDEKLVHYIREHGPGNWRTLPKNAGLERCGKSCRLRWTNYLRPDIKRGRFSFEEEEIIIQLHRVLGNKWSAIASRLPGRTDNEIKNYWNTHIRKRLMKMGIDPVTHAPRLDFFDLSSFLVTPQLDVSSLFHIQTLLNSNPQMLKLALGLMQSSHENPYNLLKKIQENQLLQTEPQVQNHASFEQLQPNHIENGCNQQIAPPFFDTSTQYLQGFSFDSTPQMLQDENFYDVPSFGNGILDQPLPENSSFNSGNNNDKLSYKSVFSTPLSSPDTSNSPPAVISCGAVEEQDNFCSSLLGLGFLEGFELDEFM